MIEINKKDKKLSKTEDTTMKEERILETRDLQEYIVNSWDVFSSEIGLPNSFFIGKEIVPHDSVKDRIDILAFDPNDPNDPKMVIIELKRGKEKTQLIQAISYAGMVHRWTSKDVIEKLSQTKTDDEVLEYFRNNETEFGIKIILIAENFDPEVIFAADWLNSAHNLSITAFKVKLHKFDQKLLLEIDQKYPLKALSDAYETRSNKQKDNSTTQRTWDDLKTNLKYNFGGDFINYLSNNCNPGDPGRARFVTNISYNGIKNLCIYFGYKYINISTTVSNKEEGINILKEFFGENFEVREGQEGLSFNIRTEEEYIKLKNFIKQAGTSFNKT